MSSARVALDGLAQLARFFAVDSAPIVGAQQRVSEIENLAPKTLGDEAVITSITHSALTNSWTGKLPTATPRWWEDKNALSIALEAVDSTVAELDEMAKTQRASAYVLEKIMETQTKFLNSLGKQELLGLEVMQVKLLLQLPVLGELLKPLVELEIRSRISYATKIVENTSTAVLSILSTLTQAVNAVASSVTDPLVWRENSLTTTTVPNPNKIALRGPVENGFSGESSTLGTTFEVPKRTIRVEPNDAKGDGGVLATAGND